MEQAPERFITNYTFVNKRNISLKVYPIKDATKESKCSKCKNADAKFVCEIGTELAALCPSCMNELVQPSELTQEKALVFPSLEKSVRSSAFEWSPNSGESWYKIHGRNLMIDTTIVRPEAEKKQKFLDIMELILLGQPQVVDCEYNKDEKKLTIFV
jgi:hypothetical protein